MGYFSNFQKLPKVNNHPMDENSPNLVTLARVRCLDQDTDQVTAALDSLDGVDVPADGDRVLLLALFRHEIPDALVDAEVGETDSTWTD
jgi:hypothetical protein